MDMESNLRELSKEEADALTSDLQAVLAKHGCEMGVTSTINLLKRVEEEKIPQNDSDGSDKNTEITDTPTAQGSEGGDKESAQG